MTPEERELYHAHLEQLKKEFPEADGAMLFLDGDEYDPVRMARKNRPPPERYIDPETGMELPTDEELKALEEAVIRGSRQDES